MKNQRFVFIILIMGLFFLTGCQPQQPADQVTLQLKWVHQAQFAGYFIALDKGYYAEENIELEILPGGPGVGCFQVPANGEADFSVVSPEGQKSTGLGLEVAKNIIIAHSGELNVESQDGGGTTFAISLPLQLSHSVNGQAYD